MNPKEVLEVAVVVVFVVLAIAQMALRWGGGK